ncbi:hypothetical protein PT7_3223 [Pusillimonas sp. T7-7]|nr:hypothetical protein PT7_3223 [Pusillimonas sp. T7-7]
MHKHQTLSRLPSVDSGLFHYFLKTVRQNFDDDYNCGAPLDHS